MWSAVEQGKFAPAIERKIKILRTCGEGEGKSFLLKATAWALGPWRNPNTAEGCTFSAVLTWAPRLACRPLEMDTFLEHQHRKNPWSNLNRVFKLDQNQAPISKIISFLEIATSKDTLPGWSRGLSLNPCGRLQVVVSLQARQLLKAFCVSRLTCKNTCVDGAHCTNGKN